MTLPTRAKFLENGLIATTATSGLRCTICQDDLNNGEQVVRVDHPTVQRMQSLCPNDREPLFEPERLNTTQTATANQVMRTQLRDTMNQLRSSWNQAVHNNTVSGWYDRLSGDVIDPDLRSYGDRFMAMQDPGFHLLGQFMSLNIQTWDMGFWRDQRERMPEVMRGLRQDAVRLRELGMASPQADVDRNVDRAQALLDEIEGYMAAQGNTVISPQLVIALRDMYRLLRDDVSEATIRRAGFGARGLR